MQDDFRELGSDGDFQECPPDVDCPVGFDIVRAPSKGSFDCVCLSTMAIGKYTHWWHGRTQPCAGSECSKCIQGSPRRWHTWLGVYSERSQRTFVLEVPAGPAKTLADYRAKHGSLRGISLSLHRAVRIGFGKPRGSADLLPACPDVAALLERMWTARPGYDSAFESPKIAVVEPRIHAGDAAAG
jgi:hypothetical protein